MLAEEEEYQSKERATNLEDGASRTGGHLYMKNPLLYS